MIVFLLECRCEWMQVEHYHIQAQQLGAVLAVSVIASIGRISLTTWAVILRQ